MFIAGGIFTAVRWEFPALNGAQVKACVADTALPLPTVRTQPKC
jgi:hypothetical protein